MYLFKDTWAPTGRKNFFKIEHFFFKKCIFLKDTWSSLVVGRISLYQGVRMRKGNLIICIL